MKREINRPSKDINIANPESPAKNMLSIECSTLVQTNALTWPNPPLCLKCSHTRKATQGEEGEEYFTSMEYNGGFGDDHLIMIPSIETSWVGRRYTRRLRAPYCPCLAREVIHASGARILLQYLWLYLKVTCRLFTLDSMPSRAATRREEGWLQIIEWGLKTLPTLLMREWNTKKAVVVAQWTR